MIQCFRVDRWRLLVLVILLAQALVSTLLMPLEDRWFLHPDDHEAYVFARHVGSGGVPVIALDNNGVSPWPLLAPPDALVMDDRIVSHRAPGLFFLLAPAAAVSPDVAFLAMMLLGALASLALYALAERLYGPKAALVSLVIFAFSAPTLFWSAFLFANLPALAFLLSGFALLTSRSVGSWVLSIILLSAAVLLRYENALLVAPVALAAVVTQRQWLFGSFRRFFLLSSTAAFALSAVLTISWILYDTVNFAAINAVPSSGAPGPKPTDLSTSYAYTIGAVHGANIAHNVQAFLLPLAVVPVVGIAIAPLMRGRLGWLMWSMGAGVLALTWFFLGNYFHPQGFLLSHSYSRYLLPLVAFGGICMAHIVFHLPRRSRVRLGAAIAAFAVVTSISLVGGAAGFESAAAYTTSAREHAKAAEALPSNAVIVGEHAAKMLLDKRVLSPTNAPEDVRRQATLDAVENLTRSGVPVFIPRAYGGSYSDWLSEDPRFDLHPSEQPIFLEIALKDGGAR